MEPNYDSISHQDAKKTIKVLSEISNAVNNTDNLDELYKSLHYSIDKILDAKNIFFALYDKKKRFHYNTLPR
jgi:hypothetical protein